jgi:hypothetical protein
VPLCKAIDRSRVCVCLFVHYWQLKVNEKEVGSGHSVGQTQRVSIYGICGATAARQVGDNHNGEL